MKKKQSVLPNLADRLELPEEALLGTAKLTVTAGRHRELLIRGELQDIEWG